MTMTVGGPIVATKAWPTNGHLIADVAALHLGWVTEVLDLTYGQGTWWTKWKPDALVTNDLDPDISTDHTFDYRTMPEDIPPFECVAYDPPYKLSGTPSLDHFDYRYGIEKPRRWQDRMEDIAAGARVAMRLTQPGGITLVKCQDQVVSGQVRWQTQMIHTIADNMGYRVRDRFDLLGGTMPQPAGRTQKHARGRGSTLLVIERPRRST